MKKTKQPETGWAAAKAEMNKRNEDARRRAEQEGAAAAQRAAAQRRHLARLEMSDLPTPTGANRPT